MAGTHISLCPLLRVTHSHRVFLHCGRHSDIAPRLRKLCFILQEREDGWPGVTPGNEALWALGIQVALRGALRVGRMCSSEPAL